MNIQHLQLAIKNGCDIVIETTGLEKEMVQTLLSTDGIESVSVTIGGMPYCTEEMQELVYLLKKIKKFKLMEDFTPKFMGR